MFTFVSLRHCFSLRFCGRPTKGRLPSHCDRPITTEKLHCKSASAPDLLRFGQENNTIMATGQYIKDGVTYCAIRTKAVFDIIAPQGRTDLADRGHIRLHGSPRTGSTPRADDTLGKWRSSRGKLAVRGEIMTIYQPLLHKMIELGLRPPCSPAESVGRGRTFAGAAEADMVDGPDRWPGVCRRSLYSSDP